MPIVLSALVGIYLLALGNAEPLIEPSAAGSIQKSLVNVSRPLGFAGECAERHPELGLDAEFEKLDKRYLDATEEAEGVWPEIDATDVEVAATEAGPPWPSCRRDNVRTALKRADKALNAHSRLFRQLTAAMDLRSAWAGPLHLCRDNVESAELKSDPRTGQPVLSIRLAPPLNATLSKITEQSVLRPLPIRLDGAVIAKPVVTESIVMGEFQVTGPERDVLSRLAERAGASC